MGKCYIQFVEYSFVMQQSIDAKTFDVVWQGKKPLRCQGFNAHCNFDLISQINMCLTMKSVFNRQYNLLLPLSKLDARSTLAVNQIYQRCQI
jgi:hypothetical protein